MTNSIWGGPYKDGITQSLLSRFIVCRERFRVYAIEGIAPVDTFNHRIEYGSMFHLAEECYCADQDWEEALFNYSSNLVARYQPQQSEVLKWWRVCKTQFPIYIKYWEKHDSFDNIEPLEQEKSFRVSYTLPSGREVILRGKWDAVHLITDKSPCILLQENKIKGDTNEYKISQQLTCDLQTMLYIIALRRRLSIIKRNLPASIKKRVRVGGVLYNVVRRPLSGGRGSIRQHKPSKRNPEGESTEEFYKRLGHVIDIEPDYFFNRWDVRLDDHDVDRFQAECIDPLLEQLCDWWDWIVYAQETNQDPFSPEGKGIHWKMPYGVYNPLTEGKSTELDDYLMHGSMTGLTRVSSVFPELETKEREHAVSNQAKYEAAEA